MKLVVQYMLPVSVFVDTETNEVERVLQENEGIYLASNWTVLDPNDSFSPDVNIEDAEAAIHIAENNDWPVWEGA